MVVYLARRMFYGFLVVVATGVIAFGGYRYLRADQYPGESLIGGTWHQLTQAFLHLDFGESCMYPGCPKIHDLWVRGIQADLWLLVGSLLVGVVGGVAAGAWCASHPRSLASRIVEGAGMFFFGIPPFVFGYGLLLLFAPDFGLVHVPLLFEVHNYREPYADPLDFIRSMIVPCLVVGLPLAGACLRLTVAMVVEETDEDYVRTARAKGLTDRLTIRRHARPAAYVAVASYVSATIPLVVTNMVLAEAVFSVPGFLVHTRRALGQTPGYPHSVDPVTLQGLALWGALMIVVVGILCDIAIVALDPRIRSAGRVG